MEKFANNYAATKIKLASLDDLFQQNAGDQQIGKIVELEVESLTEYPNHPFQVNDEELTELIESIRERGVIEPVRVIAGESGHYVIVSGHRRCRAAVLAGKKTVPGCIEDLTREEADLMMVDSNIYREKILPSEKAYAYKIKLRALKALAEKGKATDILGESENISGKSIQRYIRLTYLIPQILKDVDMERLAFGTGINLSYLPEAVQQAIVQEVETYYNISLECAEIVKNYYKHSGEMTVELFKEIQKGGYVITEESCFQEVVCQIRKEGWEKSEEEEESIKVRLFQLAEEKVLPSSIEVKDEGILFYGHKYIKWHKVFEHVLPQLDGTSIAQTEERKLAGDSMEVASEWGEEEGQCQPDTTEDSTPKPKSQSKNSKKEEKACSFEDRNIEGGVEECTEEEIQQLQDLLLEAIGEIEMFYGRETELTERIRRAL